MNVTFMTFSFTFTIVVQFATLKVYTLLVLLKIYIYIFEKKGNDFFFEKVLQTDKTLYFVTLEKMAIRLPTKCLSNYMSGLALIGD